jgi:hypothetical protein
MLVNTNKYTNTHYERFDNTHTYIHIPMP